MASQAVRPQSAHGSAASTSNPADDDDSADDCGGCFDAADGLSDPGLSSTTTSNQCSLAGDVDDDDASWTPPHDMVLLKALAAQHPGPHRACGNLPQRRLRRLPSGTRPSRLIGEGSANAVFEIKVPRRNCAGPDFNGLLLRVAKVPSLNHPPTYNYVSQQTFYQTSIKPLLGSHAVHQELVMLHNSGIVDELNNFLRDIDDSRKPRFRGSFIGQTDLGFLVQDMRPNNPGECVLIEFKPKWLSQSPSAPKSAVRCRQCAMELRNLVKDPSRDRGLPEKKPCPLALFNKDAPVEVSSPFRIAPQLAGVGRDEHFGEALRTVANHGVIRQLRAQQDLHDQLGPLYAEASDRFVIAMTLRDCTCFVQIHRHRQDVTIRVADFDWKDPRIKLERWRRAEQELIQGGFYTADRILCDGSYYRPPTLCALEFASGNRSRQAEVLNVRNRRGAGNAPPVPAAMAIDHETDVAALQQLLEQSEVATWPGPVTTAVGDAATSHPR